MKALLIAVLCCLASAAVGQQASTAPGGIVRVLDKLTGTVTDLELMAGDAQRVGLLTVQLNECRFPRANPSGDAFELLIISYDNADAPIFTGWMIASAPAISALDHYRYDVWALRCITS